MNQNTNVNLIPKFPFSGNLYFSQYDVGRVATINLVEDGAAYTIPSGATVKIQATKPSGLGFSVECTYNGNVVTVVSTETMTNEYGRFPCELRIESGDVLLGTTNFTFNVEKSPHPTNTVDGDSEDIINQITVALNNALSDIEDAKEEAIEEISQSGGGITQAVKVALLNCFSHVAWIDENGQTYYDALYDALYDVPAPTLTSISAVYTQSGTVYTTDTLDSLKSDLVVTATYSDSSSETVPSADYTLSGTLTEGTSTITVTYEEFTATFNVTVSSTRSAFEFENGYSVGVTNNVATKTSATARATTATPIPNLGYVFTSTDPTKYQVNAIDITQYKKSGNGYPTGGKTITWGETDSASTAWVWLALKKLDGTDFTTEELANGASAVFTFTRSKFGTFADGYTTVKTSAGVWRQITAARATTAVPVKNNGYAFAVTDSSKYNILVNGLNSLAEEPYSNNISADGFRYTDIDNITNSWSNSASTDAEYVWISLKKMDDTAFTTAELANDASAVFTYTEGNS